MNTLASELIGNAVTQRNPQKNRPVCACVFQLPLVAWKFKKARAGFRVPIGNKSRPAVPCYGKFHFAHTSFPDVNFFSYK